MKHDILKTALSFLIRNRHNKNICFDFLEFLRTLDLSMDDLIAARDESKLSLWYTFSEYIFFDPVFYPNNYPVPEIDEGEIVELQSWVDSLD